MAVFSRKLQITKGERGCEQKEEVWAKDIGHRQGGADIPKKKKNSGSKKGGKKGRGEEQEIWGQTKDGSNKVWYGEKKSRIYGKNANKTLFPTFSLSSVSHASH